MLDPKMLTTASLYQLGAVAVFSLVSWFAWPEGALGVFGGGLVMAGNFWFMKSLTTKAFVGPTSKAKVVYGLLLSVKFAIVLGMISIMVMLLNVNPIGIAVGMSTLFVGIAFGLFHHFGTPQQELGK